jgi:hypothetical protein
MMNRSEDTTYIRGFETLGSVDVALVGGKNASLGEMIQTLSDRSIRVPQGFATTSAAYRQSSKANDLVDPLKLQDELVRIVRGQGIRMIGPNGLGLLNTESSILLNASTGSGSIAPAPLARELYDVDNSARSSTSFIRTP